MSPMTDTVDENPVVHINRVFAASRDAAFAAFTDPEQLKLWFGPQGFTTPVAEIDPRVGGSYRIEMLSPDGNAHRLSGVFREISPLERLVFTWIWAEGEIAGLETLVTVEFRDRGGETELTLIHEMFPSAEVRDRHTEGWSSSFECLHETL